MLNINQIRINILVIMDNINSFSCEVDVVVNVVRNFPSPWVRGKVSFFKLKYFER
tara:strand:- start:696 stop:860 length:165 start_codon:yes stop_codon:yes gene_type:complete